MLDLHRESFGVISDPGLQGGHMRRLRTEELRSLSSMLPEDRRGKREVPWDRQAQGQAREADDQDHGTRADTRASSSGGDGAAPTAVSAVYGVSHAVKRRKR